MHLYITQSDVKVGVSQGNIVVASKGDNVKIETHPIGKIESVSIFGKPTLSMTFLREMLQRHISLCFYSSNAHYFGRLINTEYTSAAKQRLQAIMTLDKQFCLKITKSIICAKLANSLSLLRSYNQWLGTDEIEVFENAIQSVMQARNIDSIRGFEGVAAKTYFQCIAAILPDEFKFRVRSSRPALDPFNSMIGLGYSMLYNNMVGTIEKHGLNAYLGVLHQDREKHATLASDLMEEWRAIIVDDTVIRLILDGTITADEFEKSEKNGACYANKEASHKIIRAFMRKIALSQQYLKYDNNSYSFQYALDLQLYRFHRAMDEDNPDYYQPVSADIDVNQHDDLLSEFQDDASNGTLGATDDDYVYENDGLSRRANTRKALEKARESCSKAVKGELHTTMISALGTLINARLSSNEIHEFIDEFCDIWGDNEFQRKGYYYACDQFMNARAENQPLSAPFVSKVKQPISIELSELFIQDASTEVPLLIHRNVKYSRGDKKIVRFNELQEFEHSMRPIANNWEDGQRRKAENLLKSITFGSFNLNTRGNKNAIFRNVLLLDYDADVNNQAISDALMAEIFRQAKSITQNVILLESVSSRENQRKFHLLFLTKELDKEAYTAGWIALDAKMAELTGLHSDKSCKDIARTMFVGIRYN